MAKSNIIKALENLDNKDIYSLMLFTLFKLKDNPKYSTLSELVYILDNDNFLKFLEYFGGSTITVPTVEELKLILDSICYYEQKTNTQLSQDEILYNLNIPKSDKDKILEIVMIIENLIEKYEFKR
jgi:hypothetical protein